MASQLLSILLPVFTIAAIGWTWVRLGRPFDPATLSALVTTIGVPALLLSSLTRSAVTPASLLEMLAAGALALAAFAAIGAAVLRFVKLPVRLYLPALMLPNTGNLGLPIVFFAFGEAGMPYAVAFSTLVQIGHFTVGIGLASGRMAPRTLLTTPAIWAFLLALALIGTGTPLPGWAADAARILGGMAVPIMLLMLGASLARLSVRNLARPLGLSVVRVAMGFAVGLAAARLAGLGPEAAGALVLQCAMPVAVFSHLFAVRYGGPANEVAAMIVLSTLVCLATLPLMLRVVL
ncbi:AEC family transporter [Azospirillum halopraeferens]|uniref:AEC family transporter n=1 Tax=Azospirillum halopraeferens TaxID=34010 RepID=UPI00042A3AE6|nr:AEC family transporter [Azospirillum halopraeferens]